MPYYLPWAIAIGVFLAVVTTVLHAFPGQGPHWLLYVPSALNLIVVIIGLAEWRAARRNLNR